MYAEDSQQAIAQQVIAQQVIAGHGSSTHDAAEAAVERAMARVGQRVVALSDSLELGREHLVRFAALTDVDVLVTDDEADPAVVAEPESQGIEVFVA